MKFVIDFKSNLSDEDENYIYQGLLAHNLEEIGIRGSGRTMPIF